MFGCDVFYIAAAIIVAEFNLEIRIIGFC
jgi:hypothetical protein